ncbi:HAD-IIIC family phosphatase [Streptomyces incanus]
MRGTRTLHGNIAAAVGAGRPPAREDLRTLDEDGTASDFFRAGRALRALPHDPARLRRARVGILATGTAGPAEDILRAALVAGDMFPVVETGPYGRFEAELGVPGSAFTEADRDVLCCLLDAGYFVPANWDAGDIGTLIDTLRERTRTLCGLASAAASRTTATVVLHTVPLPTELRDSIIGWRQRTALSRHWLLLNAALLELAETHEGIETIDFAGLLAEHAAPAVDDRLRRFADISYTEEALLVLAKEVRRLLRAKLGLSRKVLALDLDDTLWGGVLGEVGAEGVEIGGLYPGNCHRELQKTALRLRSQGVVLVLTSKNDAAHVDEVLAGHPEVVLRPSEFSVRAVNWSAKVDNLREAAGQLGVAPGAFVFMDDSPFERGHVSAELPEVVTVAADGDPAYLVRRLLGGGWFDVMELTETDRQRPELYRARAVRTDFAREFASSEEYLAALGIVVSVTPAGATDVGRIAQLAARTNQFNLTGMRFDAVRTAEMARSDTHLVIGCRVSDRFGDDALVGAAWVDRGEKIWRVRNLVLSCRVLGRGVELAMVSRLARAARLAGATELEGSYVRSPYNDVAATLWTRAGFGPGPREGGRAALPARPGRDGGRSGSALIPEKDGAQVYRRALDETVDDLVPHWIRMQDTQGGAPHE